jgi:hypothetical protein
MNPFVSLIYDRMTLNTEDIYLLFLNNNIINFSSYNVQGPTNLRCWLGEWAVTSMPECVAGNF